MNVNDLISPIIKLHKKREGIDSISQREVNLLVCAIEIFEAELKKQDNNVVLVKACEIKDVEFSIFQHLKEGEKIKNDSVIKHFQEE